MSPIRRMGKNLVFKVLTEAVLRVLSFVFYVALARWLGEEPFGLFNLLYSVTAIVVFLVDPGLNIQLIRNAPRKDGYLEQTAGAVLGLKLALSSLAVITSCAYGLMAGYDAYVIALLALMGAQMAGYSLLEYASAIFQAREEMQVETFLMGTGKLLVTGSAIAAIVFGGGLGAVLSVMALSQGAVTVWAFMWTARRGVPVSVKLSLATWAGLLKGSVPLAAITFFTITFYRVDIALAPFLGLSLREIGFYAAGVKIIDVLLAAPTLMMAGVFPTLSAMAEDDRAAFSRWMGLVLLSLAFAGVAAGGAASWFSEEIISILFGAAFAPAAEPLRWLALASVFMFIRHGLLHGLIIDGRLKPAVLLTSSALPLNVVLNVALAHTWGTVGMASAKLLTELALVGGAGFVWFAGARKSGQSG